MGRNEHSNSNDVPSARVYQGSIVAIGPDAFELCAVRAEVVEEPVAVGNGVALANIDNSPHVEPMTQMRHDRQVRDGPSELNRRIVGVSVSRSWGKCYAQ